MRPVRRPIAWPLDLQHLRAQRERCDSLSEALDELQRRIVRTSVSGSRERIRRA